MKISRASPKENTYTHTQTQFWSLKKRVPPARWQLAAGRRIEMEAGGSALQQSLAQHHPLLETWRRRSRREGTLGRNKRTLKTNPWIVWRRRRREFFRILCKALKEHIASLRRTLVLALTRNEHLQASAHGTALHRLPGTQILAGKWHVAGAPLHFGNHARVCSILRHSVRNSSSNACIPQRKSGSWR